MMKASCVVLALAFAACAQAVSTVPTTQAAAPTLTTASVSACGIRVSWAAPATNGGKPVLNYKIYASGGGTTHKLMATVQGATTTTHFVTGLKRTTAYTFTTTATNEIGESAKSGASSSVTTQNVRECCPCPLLVATRMLAVWSAPPHFSL